MWLLNTNVSSCEINMSKSLPEQIVEFLHNSPGMTDREITNALRGKTAPQQPVNMAARALSSKGIIIRKKRNDGLIGNYLGGQFIPETHFKTVAQKLDDKNQLTEDEIKEILQAWLESDGWVTQIAWGRARGIDIDALSGKNRWIIEVKGIGSRSEMRVNYFIGMLGETLQRMNDPDAKYSIAMPDVQQFRNLWDRLPILAKQRTQITALFVNGKGTVEEVKS